VSLQYRGPKPQPLNVARQLLDLGRLYPHGVGRLVKNRLLWHCELKPSPFSRRYLVQIDYHLGALPTTLVLDPKPRDLAGARKPPHVYNEPGDPLCLFYPAAREWNPTMLIARTIVPWACEWLFHFEAWLFTGNWEGGGTPPSARGSCPLPPGPSVVPSASLASTPVGRSVEHDDGVQYSLIHQSNIRLFRPVNPISVID
jgi:hypothetical protein